jgi:hypothetical protein
MGHSVANCPDKDSESDLVVVFNAEVEAEGNLIEERGFESHEWF